MKTTCKIAKTELAQLFYSPIAWFLLVAFLFQCGLAYTSEIDGYLISQQLGGEGLRYLVFLTSKIFAPPFGILPELVNKLYLYLPLLTMGLMSREINGGTIKLLYSSPIKVREIIFGKFLAMMLYNLVLVLILAAIVAFALLNIHAADAGLLFSGLFGIYLLLCAYAAIGLFMSCLTSYQVVAALSTLVLLAILNYIGTLWQDIGFVRDLAYFLSIAGRVDHMLMGLITTKDILYFLVIIFIFLSFSIHKLRSDRESKPRLIKAVRYVLIIVFALALGYATSRPGFIGYFDATATRTMTLTKNSQRILRETGDAPIEVTSYINLLDNRFWYGRPEDRNKDLARWEPYLRFKPNINFKYIYYYDSSWDRNLFKYNPGMTLAALAERYIKSDRLNPDLFATPAGIRQLIDLRPEQNRYVMKLNYKGRTTFLRLFDDPMVFPSETETAAALKRLMRVRLPKIAFLQGESERSIDRIGDRDFKKLTNDITFRYSLINQGFDVETVSLKDQDIPGDIAALVIADPKVAIDTAVMIKLQKYIAAGGNMLIAGEPGKQDILNPLLLPFGVRLMPGMMVQPGKDFAPDLIQPFVTPAAAGLTRKLRDDADDSLCISMRGAAALSYSPSARSNSTSASSNSRTADSKSTAAGSYTPAFTSNIPGGPFTITPFVMTPEKLSWNKKIKPDEEEIESANSAAIVDSRHAGNTTTAAVTPKWPGLAYSAEQGDQAGPLPAVLGLTRMVHGREQRIVIAGDADFLSNSELSRHNLKTCNFDFSTALFSWFSYEEFPIDTHRPKSKDNRIRLSDAGLTFLKIGLLGILPGLLLIAGTILLLRRKRK